MEKGSPWIIILGFIIIIAGAIFHVEITLLKASGKNIIGGDFFPYLLYILGILIAVIGVFYTPPKEKLFTE